MVINVHVANCCLIKLACNLNKDFHFQDTMLMTYTSLCIRRAYIHCVWRNERQSHHLWTFSFITVHLLALLFSLENHLIRKTLLFSLENQRKNCVAKFYSNWLLCGYRYRNCYSIDAACVIPIFDIIILSCLCVFVMCRLFSWTIVGFMLASSWLY